MTNKKEHDVETRIESKMGRPPTVADEYDPIYCTMLIEHMGKGLSFESFAAKIGTYRQKLYEWEKIHPDFSDTVKRAKELCLLWWESAGVNGLYTIVEHGEGGQNVIEKKINPTMWIFNMRARFKWRDSESVDVKLTQATEREALTVQDKKALLERGRETLKRLEEELAQEDAKALSVGKHE